MTKSLSVVVSDLRSTVYGYHQGGAQIEFRTHSELLAAAHKALTDALEMLNGLIERYAESSSLAPNSFPSTACRSDGGQQSDAT